MYTERAPHLMHTDEEDPVVQVEGVLSTVPVVGVEVNYCNAFHLSRRDAVGKRHAAVQPREHRRAPTPDWNVIEKVLIKQCNILTATVILRASCGSSVDVVKIAPKTPWGGKASAPENWHICSLWAQQW